MSRIPIGNGRYVDEFVLKADAGGLGSLTYPIYTTLTSISGVTIDASGLSVSVDNSDVIAALSVALGAMIQTSGIKQIQDTVNVSGTVTASVDNSDVIAALVSGVVVNSGTLDSILNVVGTSGVIYKYGIVTCRENSALTNAYVSGVAVDASNATKANIYIQYASGIEAGMYVKIECGDSLEEVYQESVIDTSSSGVCTTYPMEYLFPTSGAYRLVYEIADKYLVVSLKGASETPTGSGMVKVKLSN